MLETERQRDEERHQAELSRMQATIDTILASAKAATPAKKTARKTTRPAAAKKTTADK
ncbi:hypothetical protein [Corynebacterium sp. CCM 9203]